MTTLYDLSPAQQTALIQAIEGDEHIVNTNSRTFNALIEKGRIYKSGKLTLSGYNVLRNLIGSDFLDNMTTEEIWLNHLTDTPCHMDEWEYYYSVWTLDELHSGFKFHELRLVVNSVKSWVNQWSSAATWYQDKHPIDTLEKRINDKRQTIYSWCKNQSIIIGNSRVNKQQGIVHRLYRELFMLIWMKENWNYLVDKYKTEDAKW